MLRVKCRSCDTTLTPQLRLLVDSAELDESDQADYVPKGFIWESDGQFHSGREGRFFVNIADVLDLQDHADSRRLSGCCGPAGIDGPNQCCECGAAVATLMADCWMPHAVAFEPGRTFLCREDRESDVPSQ